MERKIIRKNIPLLRLIQALNLTMKHLQNVPVRAVNVQVFLFFFFFGQENLVGDNHNFKHESK